jgi:hypothetical protein
MKMAMETGDTSFFLSMTQPVVGGSSSAEGGQKRRASTSSMMDSNTDDSAVGGHPHKRMSHRESRVVWSGKEGGWQAARGSHSAIE